MEWSIILIKIRVNLIQRAISKFYFENVILGPRYDVLFGQRSVHEINRIFLRAS